MKSQPWLCLIINSIISPKSKSIIFVAYLSYHRDIILSGATQTNEITMIVPRKRPAECNKKNVIVIKFIS